MACAVRQNNDIEGIIIGSTKKTLSQYADDLWIVMKHHKKCYDALFSTLYRFEEFSGLRINCDKTEILRIGSLRGTDAKYYSKLPLHWSDGPIKILGLKVVPNFEEMARLNYVDLLEKAENFLKLLAKRSLPT